MFGFQFPACRETVNAMTFDGIDINYDTAIDRSGRNTDAGIRPAGEVGGYLDRIAGHSPLGATTLFRLVGLL